MVLIVVRGGANHAAASPAWPCRGYRAAAVYPIGSALAVDEVVKRRSSWAAGLGSAADGDLG